jgi:hypothetical protein
MGKNMGSSNNIETNIANIIGISIMRAYMNGSFSAHDNGYLLFRDYRNAKAYEYSLKNSNELLEAFRQMGDSLIPPQAQQMLHVPALQQNQHINVQKALCLAQFRNFTHNVDLEGNPAKDEIIKKRAALQKAFKAIETTEDIKAVASLINAANQALKTSV